MSRRGKKTQPLPVGQPTLDEHNYRTGVRMAEKHLTNNLVISIIDECFKNGPVDLTEETSWTLIQKVIEQHCQDWNPRIEDLKNAWKDVIDGQLNELCKTDVKSKEEWAGWMTIHGVWTSRGWPEKNMSILSLRLKSVYEDRLARRGWTAGVDYKTLKDELEASPNNFVPVTSVLPMKKAASSQAACPTPAYILEWKPHDPPIAFSSNLEGSRAIQQEKFALPTQHFAHYTFLVLEQDGSLVDCTLSNVIRYLIMLHGGKILERCEPETIVVGSSDENYTARALKEFEHYGKVVTCQSLILAVTNMSNSKPWELVNDLTLGGQPRSKENPSQTILQNNAQDQHLVKTERPDENLQLKNENISDQSSQNNSENRLPNWNSNSNVQDQHYVKTEGPTENLQLKNATFTDQSMHDKNANGLPNNDPNSNDSEYLRKGIKRELPENGGSQDILDVESSQDHTSKNLCKQCQEIIHAMLFMYAAPSISRRGLAEKVAKKFNELRKEFEGDLGTICPKVGWMRLYDHFDEYWLPQSPNDIQDAFGRISTKIKEKVGIEGDSCVKHFQDFILGARNKKRKQCVH